jgi:dTDP-4-dehydrorhamnose 3,5-epimerase
MNSLPIIDSQKQNAFVQSYAPAPQIEGVKVVQIKNFSAEEGDFAEIIRINDEGGLELFPEFHLRQINRTHLFPKSIKAWHFHLKQNEIWYVAPSFHMVAGLWDLREGSPTADVTQKVVLGGGYSSLLFIPKGVAHGSVNHSPSSIQLYYFVDQRFNLNDPDEMRLHWDAKGQEFWQPERD